MRSCARTRREHERTLESTAQADDEDESTYYEAISRCTTPSNISSTGSNRGGMSDNQSYVSDPVLHQSGSQLVRSKHPATTVSMFSSGNNCVEMESSPTLAAPVPATRGGNAARWPSERRGSYGTHGSHSPSQAAAFASDKSTHGTGKSGYFPSTFATGSVSSASSDDWRYGNYAYASSDSMTSASPSPRSVFYNSPGTPFSHAVNAHSQSSPAQSLHAFSLPPASLDLPVASTSGFSCNAEISSISTNVKRTAHPMPFFTQSPLRTASHHDSSDDGDGETLPGIDDSLLQLPENFALVYPNVFRSSFPLKRHYPYLRGLGLKTVLTLVQGRLS